MRPTASVHALAHPCSVRTGGTKDLPGLAGLVFARPASAGPTAHSRAPALAVGFKVVPAC